MPIIFATFGETPPPEPSSAMTATNWISFAMGVVNMVGFILISLWKIKYDKETQGLHHQIERHEEKIGALEKRVEELLAENTKLRRSRKRNLKRIRALEEGLKDAEHACENMRRAAKTERHAYKALIQRLGAELRLDQDEIVRMCNLIPEDGNAEVILPEHLRQLPPRRPRVTGPDQPPDTR